MKSKQKLRRQRELLSLFVSVTDRLVSVETHLREDKVDSNSHSDLEDKARRGAAVLSNISQLLHFISKDIDLQHVFQVSYLTPADCSGLQTCNTSILPFSRTVIPKMVVKNVVLHGCHWWIGLLSWWNLSSTISCLH